MTHILIFLQPSDIYVSPKNCDICDQQSDYIVSLERKKEMEFKKVIFWGNTMSKYSSNKYPKKRWKGIK